MTEDLVFMFETMGIRTCIDMKKLLAGREPLKAGLLGDALRAGTRVNDMMGGMFGAIGAVAALAAREKTGKGQEVQSALFENNVFLVAQHMMQFAVTGKAAASMPGRLAAWAIYDVCTVKYDEQIFLAAVSDMQWLYVIDNRRGGSGNIGLDFVAKSKPDGLTFGMGQTANLAINPAIMKMLFDPAKDVIPVALIREAGIKRE